LVALVFLVSSARASAQQPAAIPPSPTATRAEAQDHALRAQAYFKANRLSEAEAEFKAALTSDPTWHEVLFNLAVVYDAEGHLDQAVAALKQYRPFAAPSERDALGQRIAEMEIKLEDQRKAAAEAERAAQAERDRQARAEREEHERQERQRLATEEEERRQQVEFHGAADSDGLGWVVSVTPQGGRAIPCKQTIKEPLFCSLHVPPGPAEVAYDGNSDPIWVSEGPSRVDLRWTAMHSTGIRVPVIIAGAVAMAGGLVPGEIGLLNLVGATESSSSLKTDNTTAAVEFVGGALLLAAGTVALVYGIESSGTALDYSGSTSSSSSGGAANAASSGMK